MIKGAREAVGEMWFIGIVHLVQPFCDFISFSLRVHHFS